MHSLRGSTLLFSAFLLAAAVLLLPSPSLLSEEVKHESQEVKHERPACDLSGTWYGGSIVGYQMTITPSVQMDHYIALGEGMYKNSVMNTSYTGELVKRGKLYEGPLMQLTTSDPDFLNWPPPPKMPDIVAAWSSLEMVDCNTIRNTIPFFGMYFAANIWQPGVVWVAQGKVPLIDAPDADLLDALAGGKPIVETYHRLPKAVNPILLHHD
jgi:hypothetical protein